MVSLLESKLNSLPPEITNNYPDLVHMSLNDINPEILKIGRNQNNSNVNINNFNENNTNTTEENHINNNDNNLKQEVVEINKEPTAQEKLTKLIEENEDLTSYYNMMKFKIPIAAVLQKAKFQSFRDFSLIEKLIEMYTEAHPYDVV